MGPGDFSYELPHELIAQYPPKHHGDSRLLRLARDSGALSHHRFDDLEAMLTPGDLLVFNDTRVIPARLFGNKESGGRIELLLERLLDTDRILVQINAAKPPRAETTIRLDNGVLFEVEGRQENFYLLRAVAGAEQGMLDMFIESGHIPLPPYIRRPEEPLDRERYQTLFAREYGAVAAPTAGLHFTRRHLDALAARGIGSAFITLHVGAGTFQPVRVEDIREHRMHREWFRIPRTTCDAIEQARKCGGRIIAVGTTTVRALESAAQTAGLGLVPGEYETEIFISPGYDFKVVQALITNFHLPGSTLLMLVCAFAGRENVLNAYARAIREKYRFYSYGDAMFIIDEG
jgi:S-adenosylmethionine:tRNA ribosyltransferase-isomerase